MPEFLGDILKTTLSGAITNVATSLTLAANPSGLVPGQTLNVLLEPGTVNAEWITLTVPSPVSTTYTTIARGGAGTSAVAHSNGVAAWVCGLTGRALTQIEKDVVRASKNYLVNSGPWFWSSAGDGTTANLIDNHRCIDGWFAETTGAVACTLSANPATAAGRKWNFANSSGSTKGVVVSQMIAASDTYALQGRSATVALNCVTLGSSTITMAVFSSTLTADTATGVVSSWTSTTPNFAVSSVGSALGTQTLSAGINSLTVSVPSGCKNLIVAVYAATGLTNSDSFAIGDLSLRDSAVALDYTALPIDAEQIRVSPWIYSAYQSANFTAVQGLAYLITPNSSNFTATLPIKPRSAKPVRFVWPSNVSGSYKCTIAVDSGEASAGWVIDNGNFGDSVLYVKGDWVEYTPDLINQVWRVTGEGRQRHKGAISQSTAVTSGSSTTYYTMPLDTLVSDTGGIVSTGSGGIVILRPGTYDFYCVGTVRTAALAFIRFYINSGGATNFGVYTGTDQNMTVPVRIPQRVCSAGDLIQMQGYWSVTGGAVNLANGTVYATEISK